jgi:hypothetical protein
LLLFCGGALSVYFCGLLPFILAPVKILNSTVFSL